MGGGAGGADLPDSDDEDEEAPGEPMKAKGDGLGDLEGEVDKNPSAATTEEVKPAETKNQVDDELD